MNDETKKYIDNDINSIFGIRFDCDRLRRNLMMGTEDPVKMVINGEIFNIAIDSVDLSKYHTDYEEPSADIRAHLVPLIPAKERSVTRTYANGVPRIKNVIFNEPATIVFWEDGTKTVVKCDPEYDFYDPEKGIAMAIVKKMFGNKGNYFNEIEKWTKEYYEKEAEIEEQDKIGYVIDVS